MYLLKMNHLVSSELLETVSLACNHSVVAIVAELDANSVTDM